MRVMVIIKANKESESGVGPDEQMLTEMGKFNEDLVNAGVMLAGEGLHPSSKGKRVRFTRDKVTVIDGPFTETKELIAGYWIWRVKSLDEAADWVKRLGDRMNSAGCPLPSEGEVLIEIRQVHEMEDLGPEFTPELREQEASQRARIEQIR
jgi:hypothetical protein